MEGNQFLSAEKLETVSKLREKEMSLNNQGKVVEEMMAKLDKAFEHHETVVFPTPYVSKHRPREVFDYSQLHSFAADECLATQESDDLQAAQRELQLIREKRAQAIEQRVVDHAEALKNMERMREAAFEKARKEATEALSAKCFFSRRTSVFFKCLHIMTVRSGRAFIAQEKGRMMLLTKSLAVIAQRAAMLTHMRALTDNADTKLRFDTLVNSLQLMMAYKIRSMLLRRANAKARHSLIAKALVKLFLFKERSLRYFRCAARARRRCLVKSIAAFRLMALRREYASLTYHRAANHHALKRFKQQVLERIRTKVLDMKRNMVADHHRTGRYFRRFLRRVRERVLRRITTHRKAVAYYTLVSTHRAFAALLSQTRRNAARRHLLVAFKSKYVVNTARDALHRLLGHARRTARARAVRTKEYFELAAQGLRALFDHAARSKRFVSSMKTGITYQYFRVLSAAMHLWKNHMETSLVFDHQSMQLPRVHLRRLMTKCFQTWSQHTADAYERRASAADKLRELDHRHMRRCLRRLIDHTMHRVGAKHHMRAAADQHRSIKSSSMLLFVRSLHHRVVDRREYDTARRFYRWEKLRRGLEVWVQHTSNGATLRHLRTIGLGTARLRPFLRRWQMAVDHGRERRAFLRDAEQEHRWGLLKRAWAELRAQHQRRAEETLFIRDYRRSVLYPILQRRFLTEMTNRLARKDAFLRDPRRCKYQLRKALLHWPTVTKSFSQQRRDLRDADRFRSFQVHPHSFKVLCQRMSYIKHAMELMKRATRHRKQLGWDAFYSKVQRLIDLRRSHCRAVKVGRTHRSGLQKATHFDYLAALTVRMKRLRILKSHAKDLRWHLLAAWAFRGLKQDYLASQRAMIAPWIHFCRHSVRALFNRIRYRMQRRKFRSAITLYGQHSRIREALWMGWVDRHLITTALKASHRRARQHLHHRVLAHCLHHWVQKVDYRRQVMSKERRNPRRGSTPRGGRVPPPPPKSKKRVSFSDVRPAGDVGLTRALRFLYEYSNNRRYFKKIHHKVRNTHTEFIVVSALRTWRDWTIAKQRQQRTVINVHQHTLHIRRADFFPIVIGMIHSRRAVQDAKQYYTARIVRDAWKALKRRAHIGVKRVKHTLLRKKSSSLSCKASPGFIQPAGSESIYQRSRRGSFKLPPSAVIPEALNEEDSAAGAVEQPVSPGRFLNRIFPANVEEDVMETMSDVSANSDVTPGPGGLALVGLSASEDEEYFVVHAGDFRIRKQKSEVAKADRLRVQGLQRRFVDRLILSAQWRRRNRAVVKAHMQRKYRSLLRRMRRETVAMKVSRSLMRKGRAIRLFLQFKRFVIHIVAIRDENRSLRRMKRCQMALRWKAWNFYVLQLKSARKVQDFVRSTVDHSNKAAAFAEWVRFTVVDRLAEKSFSKVARRQSLQCFTALFRSGKTSRRQRMLLRRAVKYHLNLVLSAAMKRLLIYARRKYLLRKKFTLGGKHVLHLTLARVMDRLHRHARFSKRHRALQVSLKREILMKYFRRGFARMKQLLMRHVQKRLTINIHEEHKKMRVVKTLAKMAVKNTKLACVAAWKSFVRSQAKAARHLLRATLHFMRKAVKRHFRKLLSYARMRNLRRRQTDRLLLIQRQLMKRRVLSKLDLNAVWRWSRDDEQRLWVIETRKRAMARAFIKVFLVTKHRKSNRNSRQR